MSLKLIGSKLYSAVHVITICSGFNWVFVKWLFPIKEGSKYYDGEWKITKPDTHNMNKLPFDIMTELGYWTDDAIVASEIIEKFWADVPGIYIKIKEL